MQSTVNLLRNRGVRTPSLKTVCFHNKPQDTPPSAVIPYPRQIGFLYSILASQGSNKTYTEQLTTMSPSLKQAISVQLQQRASTALTRRG